MGRVLNQLIDDVQGGGRGNPFPCMDASVDENSGRIWASRADAEIGRFNLRLNAPHSSLTESKANFFPRWSAQSIPVSLFEDAHAPGAPNRPTPTNQTNSVSFYELAIGPGSDHVIKLIDSSVLLVCYF